MVHRHKPKAVSATEKSSHQSPTIVRITCSASYYYYYYYYYFLLLYYWAAVPTPPSTSSATSHPAPSRRTRSTSQCRYIVQYIANDS